MNNRSLMELLAILRAGGGLKLSAARYDLMSLLSLAKAATSGNARLELRDTNHLTQMDLLSIGRAGAGRVIFE